MMRGSTGAGALLAPAALAATAVALASRRSLRRRVLRQAAQGLAALASPRRYVVQVASWPALARLARLGSLACFLAAFALPATVATALLVMAVEGGARVVPVGPVSAGLRIAALSSGLPALSGQPADPVAIAAFTLGTGATLLVVMVAIATVLILRELGTASPWRAVKRARVRLQPVSVEG